MASRSAAKNQPPASSGASEEVSKRAPVSFTRTDKLQRGKRDQPKADNNSAQQEEPEDDGPAWGHDGYFAMQKREQRQQYNFTNRGQQNRNLGVNTYNNATQQQQPQQTSGQHQIKVQKFYKAGGNNTTSASNVSPSGRTKPRGRGADHFQEFLDDGETREEVEAKIKMLQAKAEYLRAKEEEAETPQKKESHNYRGSRNQRQSVPAHHESIETKPPQEKAKPKNAIPAPMSPDEYLAVVSSGSLPAMSAAPSQLPKRAQQRPSRGGNSHYVPPARRDKGKKKEEVKQSPAIANVVGAQTCQQSEGNSADDERTSSRMVIITPLRNFLEDDEDKNDVIIVLQLEIPPDGKIEKLELHEGENQEKAVRNFVSKHHLDEQYIAVMLQEIKEGLQQSSEVQASTPVQAQPPKASE